MLLPVSTPAWLTQVCAKVFCQKRKEFNSQAARVAGTEAAKFVAGPRKGAKPAAAS